MSVIFWHFGLLRKKNDPIKSDWNFKLSEIKMITINCRKLQSANLFLLSGIWMLECWSSTVQCTLCASLLILNLKVLHVEHWCAQAVALPTAICVNSCFPDLLPSNSDFQSQSVLHSSLLTSHLAGPVWKHWCYPTLPPSPSRASRLDDCLLRARKLRELAQRSNAPNHSGRQDVTIHLLGMETRVGRHIDSGL